MPWKLAQKVEAILENKNFTYILAISWVLAMMLIWRGDFRTDDLIHRAILDGSEELYAIGFENANPNKSFVESVNPLFAFVSGEKHFKQQLENGVLPWWSHQDLKLAFWRPFSAFTHWLDYQLWPDNYELMLFHNFLWHAGLLMLIGVLYKQLKLAPVIAGLAIFIYLVDASFMPPVTWLANRNAILAAFWGVLALIMHIRWRQGRSAAACAVSLVSLVFALLSGESGIGICAFLFAYALCLENGRLYDRLWSLLPAGLVVIGWRLVYSGFGFGTKNSGLYIDPLEAGVDFLVTGVFRQIVMHFYQYSGLDTIFNPFSSAGKILLLLFALAFLMWVFRVAYTHFREDRIIKFAFVGSFFSTLPSCASAIPSGRLLFIAAIGASIIIARVILLSTPNVRLPHKVLKVYFIAMHLIIGSTIWIGSSVATRFVEPKAMPDEINLETAKVSSSDRVILVNAPLPFFVSHLPFYRYHLGLGQLKELKLLAPAYTPLTLKRVSETSLEIKAVYGFSIVEESSPHSDSDDISIHKAFLFKALGNIYRGSHNPFQAGEIIELGDVKIDVLEVNEIGDPVKVRFNFSDSLSSFKWLFWNAKDERFETLALPTGAEVIHLASSVE